MKYNGLEKILAEHTKLNTFNKLDYNLKAFTKINTGLSNIAIQSGQNARLMRPNNVLQDKLPLINDTSFFKAVKQAGIVGELLQPTMHDVVVKQRSYLKNSGLLEMMIANNEYKAKLIIPFLRNTNEVKHINSLIHYNKGFEAINVAKELNTVYKKTFGLSEMFRNLFNENIADENLSVDVFEAEMPAEEQKSVIISMQDEIVRLLYDLLNNRVNMFNISSRNFEEIVAELLRAKGFYTELTKRTRDGGYDIIALQSLGDYKHKFLVECKRNKPTRKVGIEIVRSLMHVVDQNDASRGMIVTTSTFSKDTIDYKTRRPYKLDLHDGLDVSRWIKEYFKKY